MIKSALTFSFLIACASGLHAQSFTKYAGEFMAGGTGARYLGMGNSAVSLTNDAYAVYWNPAGLIHVNNTQLAVMHAERFSGLVSLDFVSVAVPWQERYSIGLGVLRSGVDDLPDTRDGWDFNLNRPKTGFVPSYFNAADYVFYGSFAAQDLMFWPVGFTAKYIYRSYGSVAGAWGIGLDAGTQKKGVFFDNLTVGIVLRDITSTLIVWESGTSELIPPSAETGVSAEFDLPVGSLLVAAGVINRLENRRSTAQFNWGALSHDFKAGAEWQYRQTLALRAGYNELERVNLGAGFRLQTLWIDYAFEHFSGDLDLGNSHRISVTFDLNRLGPTRNVE
ncbi:MAG: PorV/PorQ family protein [Bacteroidetes bacterium]|nr:PorV/PorQ family protein [Bacteroidota bacterium]